MKRRSEQCGSLCEQARTARDQGWPDQAELLLNEAIRQHPNDLETRRQLAEAMWSAGRHDEALAELAELVRSYPRDANLRTQQASLLWTHKNREAAESAAEQALQLDPHSIGALLVKARAEAARGELKSSLASYIRLTQLAPDRLEAKLELAEIHVRRGHPDQACPLLRDAMQSPQSTPEQTADAEWRLGLAYAAAQRWGDAANHLGRAIERREASDRDWQCLATAKAFSGQDTGGAQAMARMASARRFDEEPASVWTELRDGVARHRPPTGRSSDVMTNDASHEGVIRADFRRSELTSGFPSHDSLR